MNHRILMGKTVIFDLGGVYFCDGTRIAIDAIAVRYNIERQRVEDVVGGDLGKQYRTGMLTADQFWNAANTYWKTNAPPAVLSRIWCESYQPNAATVKIVERLKNAGHELLYLSDNTGERVAYLHKKSFFLDKFDDGIFSHVVQRKKPDPIMYQLVLAKASHPAEACVYIDDKPEFLAPARNLGMAVIAFRDAAQLESELKKLALLSD